jgi:hypothetical protein
MRRVLSLLARVRSGMVKTLCVSVGIRRVRASFSGSRSVAKRRGMIARIRVVVKTAFGGGKESLAGDLLSLGENLLYSLTGDLLWVG